MILFEPLLNKFLSLGSYTAILIQVTFSSVPIQITQKNINLLSLTLVFASKSRKNLD
jgi:hypothetical protein